jgi:5'-methylthioadenosine/S-adenosylhomocysteine nucleosidase
MIESYPDCKYVILGAVQEEIEAFVSALEHSEKHQWLAGEFWTGFFLGVPVVISKSGLGKVAAAMTVQHLIDKFHPEAVMFTGVGGGLNPDFEIGDVVVAKDCVQHDLDGTGLGFSRGTVPFTDHRFFKTDQQLFDAAISASIKQNIFSGRIATGDIFLTQSHQVQFEYLKEELQADVVEMEGAAVGQVCTMNKIPYLVIRTISDKANEQATHDFQSFMPIVAKNSFEMVSQILKTQ